MVLHVLANGAQDGGILRTGGLDELVNLPELVRDREGTIGLRPLRGRGLGRFLASPAHPATTLGTDLDALLRSPVGILEDDVAATLAVADDLGLDQSPHNSLDELHRLAAKLLGEEVVGGLLLRKHCDGSGRDDRLGNALFRHRFPPWEPTRGGTAYAESTKVYLTL